MDASMIGGVLLLVAVVAIIVYIALRQPSEEDMLRMRMMEYGDRATPVSLEEIELSLPFMQRIVVPIVQKGTTLVTRFMPANVLESTRHKLELAGRPRNLGAAEFMVIRFVAAGLMGGLTFLLFLRITSEQIAQFRPFLPPLMMVFGFLMPSIWLGSRISSRQGAIVRALPDALDLLTICVEAGLGFDAAISKITEKWEDPLALEFGRAVQEMALGKLRREALRDMSNRMDVPDVSTFVAAVIQASQLGVSMSKVLRIQSEQMRMRRRQRAEEKAQQAPIKMLFPMAFLIFPALFIVLLGPSVIVILESGVAGVV